MLELTEDSRALWKRSASLIDFEATMSALLRPCRVGEQRGARYQTEVLHDRIAGLGLTAVRTGGKARVTVAPDRSLSLLQIPISGAFDSHCTRQDSQRYEANAAAQLVDAQAPLDLDFHEATRMLIIDLTPAQFDALGGAKAISGGRGHHKISMKTDAGRRLMRFSRFLLTEVEAGPMGAQCPDLGVGLEQALIAAVGGALDSASMQSSAASAHCCGPLSRAERFMRENLDQALTPADIAEAAGLSPRSLHRLFRTHRSTTPLAAFKDMRLMRVHEDILAGRCAPNGLTALALDWGFNHSGLFAADYRRKFGHSPSETLRARRAGSLCGYGM